MPEHKISDMSEEQLRAFIREEVRKALADILGAQTQAYRPRNLEYKSVDNPDLPAWARNGQWS